MYCIVLYCIVLYCIVLYCIVLYCIVLYCVCVVLYCTRISWETEGNYKNTYNKSEKNSKIHHALRQDYNCVKSRQIHTLHNKLVEEQHKDFCDSQLGKTTKTCGIKISQHLL